MNILKSYRPGSKSFQDDLSNLYCKKYKKNSLIFLLRHGQIQGYETKRFIGRTDVSLSVQGENQAKTWQKALQSIKFNTVYSSSLKRCLNTTRLVCPKTEILIDPRLNEINMGDWDGETFADIKKNRSEEFKKRGQQIYKFQPSNGESFKNLSERVISFFNKLQIELTGLNGIESSEPDNSPEPDNTSKIINQLNMNGNRTLVVTHAGVIRTITCHILNMNPEELFKIKPDYCQLTVLKISGI